MKITKEYFFEKTGKTPVDDDLERCNCPQAGEIGHRSCGWCKICEKPIFMCKHTNINPAETHIDLFKELETEMGLVLDPTYNGNKIDLVTKEWLRVLCVIVEKRLNQKKVILTCVKDPDTCDSIPPGSCGPDCHGFEC